MSFTHNITRTWSGPSGSLSKTTSQSADAEENRSFSVADAQTDVEIALVIDVSAMKALYMVSSRAVTIETNSSSSPAQTITLAANVPLVWTVSDPDANPLTVDVTKIFVTNASGGSADIEIRVLVDPTP